MTRHIEQIMFKCQESGCEEKFDFEEELTVHRSYHEYHQKIKDQAKKELEILETRLNMPIKCPLQDRLEGCYYFPQLPSRLICEWTSCHEAEFFSAEKFYNHVSQHAHRTVDKCYWKNCNKEFKNVTLALLRDHLRVHTLQKLYACPYCGNFFSTKIKFDDHFLRHMELPEFLRDCRLQPTSVQHHGGELEFYTDVYNVNGGDVKVFRCGRRDCDKAFLTSSLLREHIQLHSIKNRCDQCPFVAKSASRLESHKLYRHQTERNFECTICLKAFKQRGDLRAHVRRHQIVEPYRCDKCDFETLNEEGLNKHMKLHSDNCDYRCHICHRTFSRGNNLSRHLKDLHKLEPPNGLCRFRYKLNELGVYVLDIGESECTTYPETTNHSLQTITGGSGANSLAAQRSA